MMNDEMEFRILNILFMVGAGLLGVYALFTFLAWKIMNGG